MLLIAASAIIGYFVSAGHHSAEKVETIRVAAPALEQTALLYLANEQKFFARNGLKVVISDCDTGVTALKELHADKADIAEAAEFPIVKAFFDHQPIMIIACNDRFENDYLIVRTNRGITKIADLKRKRIGVALGTITEFYLHRLLWLNDIDPKEITIVDVIPARYAASLADNEVDALIAWQPFVHRIQEQEGRKVAVWPAQSSQAVYSLLACNKDWLAEHAGAARRFLKSLFEAEEYLLRHPEAAGMTIQHRLGYSDAYMRDVWPQHQFSLSLDQTLVLLMKDQAQWLIRNRLTAEHVIPDITQCIDSGPLRNVKREAVNIIQ